MTTRGEVVVGTPDEVGGPGRSAFDDVYRAERAAVVRLAALLVGSQAVAEELAHDAFLRLFERLDDVEIPPGFLRTVVVRLAVSWQRRHRTELRVIQRVGVDRPTSIPEIDETWEVLQRLDPDRRTVLVLRYYERLRHREIAELLGCPVATVRSRTRRALKDLKKELTR
ncbi:MAG TPA: sigma-70 family RNA polymerase sigma factor [Acidimicrobiales bacterium]|nr:sigma-70 family RNA polymerase sigma factor [Acidimicrobiales bacterium]